MMQALTNATTATTNSTIELILRQFPRWSCRCTNVVPSNWFHAGRSRRLQHKKKSPAPTASIGAIGHGTTPQHEPTGPLNLVGWPYGQHGPEKAPASTCVCYQAAILSRDGEKPNPSGSLTVPCRRTAVVRQIAVLQESSTGALQKIKGGASPDNVDER